MKFPLALFLCSSITAAVAATPPAAQDLMLQVADRTEAPWQTATMVLTVTQKTGAPQIKEAAAFSRIEASKRQSAIYFRAPGAMKKTAFLSVDQPGDASDEQWLYVPALQTVRRVPSANRGESFLGTDLSYEDVRRVGKVSPSDYQFSQAKLLSDGRVEVVGMATPEASKALGHAKATWIVDPQSLFVVEAEYSDAAGQPLKRTRTEGVRQLQSFWTAETMTVDNLKTGSRTVVAFRDVKFGEAFEVDLLSPKGLQSGKGLK